MAPSENGSQARSEAKDYGEAWPFTISAGTLRCDGPGRVTLESKGKTYAINGLASGQADEEGWREVEEIWADDPEAGIGTKKNVGAVLDDGLALCESGEGSLSVSGTPGEIGADLGLPSEEEQQAMGLRTFSDFTPGQKQAYRAAYDLCLVEVNAGDYLPELDQIRTAAESIEPNTGDAAWEGCSDAIAGTPITGSGIEPPA